MERILDASVMRQFLSAVSYLIWLASCVGRVPARVTFCACQDMAEYRLHLRHQPTTALRLVL